MLISRREAVLGAGVVAMSSAITIMLRDKVDAVQAEVENIVDAVQAREGFVRAAYTPRAGAAHCVHNGYGYIAPGWKYGSSGPYFVPGVIRFRDFERCYVATDADGMVPAFLNGMASDGTRLQRAFGCDTYPALPSNDLVTDKAYSSLTGNGAWTEEAHSMPPRECIKVKRHGDYLYTGLGIRYSGGTNPTYVMPRDIWRKPVSGGPWALRNSDIGFKRRDSAMESVGNRILVIGGAVDLQDSSPLDWRTVKASILVTDDDFATVTDAGNGPFGPLYGHSSTQAWGHVIIAGGAYGDGAFHSQVAFTGKCWAAPVELAHDPDEWFEIGTLPVASNHGMMLTLQIHGVDVVGYWAAYNNITNPNGPIGKFYTLDGLDAPWQARPDSDFWVA